MNKDYSLRSIYKLNRQIIGCVLVIFILIFPPKMSSDNLRYYYQHLYPYNAMYKWLTYNNTLPFDHRQLSFEYPNESVQRYVKFKSPQEMKARMTSIDEQAPRKVDAGAIWTGPPAKDNKQFKPMQRQFIFDFDMNDYDDVRTCCEGKRTCQKCWKFMLVAKDVITTTLQQDFGFSKFMYVFSGGRGMHIWVCDEQARKMPDSLRKSIVDYLQVVTGNSKASSLLAQNTIPTNSKVFNRIDSKNKQFLKQQILTMTNPHILRSLSIIKKWFKQIFEQQGSIKNEKCQEVIYRIIQNRSKKLMQRVKQRWAKCEQNLDTMWVQMCEEIQHYQMTLTDQEYPLKSHELKNRKFQRMTFIEQQIFLAFLYPRMDYNVSTMQNHLLKLPFSIHPSTKKVSVPLFSQQVYKFNPKSCVTLDDLIKQLHQLEKQDLINYKDTAQNAHKTLLSQYLSALEYFCNDL